MKEKKSRHLDYQPVFNRQGKSLYVLDSDEIHIYSMAGEPVAFVDKEAVFNFSGKHLGWFEDGWLRDMDGKCVGFVESAGGGGPSKPKKKSQQPEPGPRKDPPPHPEDLDRPGKPIKISAWSEKSATALLEGQKK